MIGHGVANLYRQPGLLGARASTTWATGASSSASSPWASRSTETPPSSTTWATSSQVYVQANARAEKEPEFDAAPATSSAHGGRRRGGARPLEGVRATSRCATSSRIYGRLGIKLRAHRGREPLPGQDGAGHRRRSPAPPGVKESQGALIVDLPYAENEPPILLKKADGSTLYATRDLAAAEDRYERFHFHRSLYVVATDQALHFRQLFRVLETMGKPWAHHAHPRQLRPRPRDEHPQGPGGAAQRRARRGQAPAPWRRCRRTIAGGPHRTPETRSCWRSRSAWAPSSSATSRTAGPPTTPSTGTSCSTSTGHTGPVPAIRPRPGLQRAAQARRRRAGQLRRRRCSRCPRSRPLVREVARLPVAVQDAARPGRAVAGGAPAAGRGRRLQPLVHAGQPGTRQARAGGGQ